MVRNNKRRAFTIVELVIVIAVIAILAAVMIPTFGGIIKKANISADTQIAASMNTQLSIYKAEGKKIETEADLWAALSSDADFTSQLDPKSAKHGYHYWYDAEKNEIKLLSNEQVLEERTQPAMNAGGDEIATPFAYAAPRLINGFYLLDKVADDKSTNDIAKFFDVIEKMGEKTKADYQQAITDLEALKNSNKNDNQALADAILARISKTAVMTDKGAFINTDNDKNKEINFIYIPAAPTGATNYYLNHTVNHATDAEITDLLDLVKVAEGSVIEIPEGVKIAEGTLVPFGNIVVKVDVENDDVTNLKNVFAAGAVADDAIVQIGGATYTVDGHEVKNSNGETVEGADLLYLNPVTNFAVSATGNVVAASATTGYIALDTIRNGINLTLYAHDFAGTEGVSSPVYEAVEWTADVAGIVVDTDGTVTFLTPETFNADTIVFTATAVATNDRTNPVTKTFTVTVVELTSATINISGSDTAQKIVPNGEYTPGSFIVNYDDANSAANFVVVSFEYNNKEFTATDIQTMGISTPVVEFEADTYFTVGEDHKFAFIASDIETLEGAIGAEKVTVKVSDKATEFTAYVTVKVNDNTNVPLKIATPEYTTNDDGTTYIYKVGNLNELSLEELFAEKNTGSDFSDYKIYIFSVEPELDGDGYYHFDTPVVGYDNPAVNTPLSFANQTGYRWVVLATVGEVNEDEIKIEGIEKAETINMNKVNVISAENITAADFDLNANTHAQKEIGKDTVLHDNLDFQGNSDRSVIVLKDGADLYANYFTISAKEFYDANSSTTSPTDGGFANSGYGLILMNGNSVINDLILDGPVYPEIATGSSENGYYFFGIVTVGTGNVINNSYLFGFCSPVRIQGNDMVINNTVLEGGTWSNLWINKAETITLQNVTTKQDHIKGYASTVASTRNGKTYGKVGTAIIGMGVYIHDDQQSKALEIKLVGDVTNYNWFTKNGTDFGGNASLAKTIVFDSKYSQFIHTIGDNQYVNGAFAYQCLELSEMTITYWLFGERTTSIGKLIGFEAKDDPQISIDRTQLNSGVGLWTNKTDTITAKGGTLKKAMPTLEDEIKNRLDTDNDIVLGIINAGLELADIPLDVWAYTTMHGDGNQDDTDDNHCATCEFLSSDWSAEFANVFKNYNPVSDYRDGSAIINH